MLSVAQTAETDPSAGGGVAGVALQGDEMFMFDFFLAALSLAPLGFFLLFWSLFPHDHSIHPIYRESRTETTDKKTEAQDANSRKPHRREVEGKCEVA